MSMALAGCTAEDALRPMGASSQWSFCPMPYMSCFLLASMLPEILRDDKLLEGSYTITGPSVVSSRCIRVAVPTCLGSRHGRGMAQSS